MFLPVYESARNGAQKCAVCKKKIAKGSPWIRVELIAPPDPEDGYLHPDCVARWVDMTDWPGGYPAFAREVIANSTSLSAELREAAGPTLSVGNTTDMTELLYGDEVTAEQVLSLVEAHLWDSESLQNALEWMAQHGTLADVRRLIAGRRWPASSLTQASSYALARDLAFLRELLAGVDPRERVLAIRGELCTLISRGEPEMIALAVELARTPGAVDEYVLAAIVEAGDSVPPELLAATREQATPAVTADAFWFNVERQMHRTPSPGVVGPLAEGLDATISNAEGLRPIHAAAIAALPDVVRTFAGTVNVPLDREVTKFAVTAGPEKAGVGPDGEDYYEVRYVRLVLPAGATALDIVEALRRQITTARAAWKSNAVAKADSKKTADELLGRWHADLTTTLEVLEELGARKGKAVPEPKEASALRAQFLSMLRAIDAAPEVIDAVSDARGEGTSPGRLLLSLLSAVAGRATPAAERQEDRFWRTVLGSPSSGVVWSADPNFDDIHFYDGKKETAWDWDSRAKAIDVGEFNTTERKLLAKAHPFALAGDNVWILTGLDTKQEQLAVVTLERPSVTKLGPVAKFCSATLVP